MSTFEIQVNSFSEIINASSASTLKWTEIDLQTLIDSCEEQAIKIAEHQEEGLASRKQLATTARAFRLDTAADPELSAEWKARSADLLKFFKGEVDLLATRAKIAENAFLTTYRLLREAPDPAVELKHFNEVSQAFLKATELELERLNAEKKDLEAAALMSGTGVTGVTMGDTAQRMVTEEERQALRAELEAHNRQETQRQLQQLQEAYQREIMDMEKSWEQKQSASNLQVQMLQEEMEVLQEKSVKYDGAESRLNKSETARLEAEEELVKCRNEIADVRIQLDQESTRANFNEENLKRVQQSLSRTVSELKVLEETNTTQITSLNEEIDRLNRELSNRPNDVDITALQEKVRLLEGLDSTFDDEEETTQQKESLEEKHAHSEDLESGRSSGTKETKDGGVDEWLVGYNKRLKAELGQLRQALRQTKEAKNVIEVRTNGLQATIDQQQATITQLEGDLVSAHQVVEAGKAMLRSFQTGKTNIQVNQVMLAKASAMTANPGADGETTVVGGGFGPADRLLQAIQSQRDRFKREAQAFEGENNILKKTVHQLKEEAKALKQDNMHLYKKLRFGNQKSLTKQTRDTRHKRSKDRLEDVEDDVIVSKYQVKYESSLNPFAQYDQEERDEIFKQLNPAEHVLLAILKDKCRRTVFVLYFVSVHLYIICTSKDIMV